MAAEEQMQKDTEHMGEAPVNDGGNDALGAGSACNEGNGDDSVPVEQSDVEDATNAANATTDEGTDDAGNATPTKRKRDADALTGEPMPEGAPWNWGAWYSSLAIIAGFALGFMVPLIGFVFYMLSGAVAIILSLMSLFSFRKYGVPSATVGTLVIGVFLFIVGTVQFLVIPSFIGALGELMRCGV